MALDPSFWNTALQLGIGGLSVAGIIYVSLKHAELRHALFLRRMVI